MKIFIDIKAIAEEAAHAYRRDGDCELEYAPMVDIADCAASAVSDYLDNLHADLFDQLVDLVEQEIQG
jgi:hypothetical protein